MNNDSDKRELFYALSAILTGFSTFDLQGTGVGQTYYDVVNDIVGTDIFIDLLDAFRRLEQQYRGQALENKVREHILGDARSGPVARNIIKLWYLGSWDKLPDDWRSAYRPHIDNEPFVVSAQAYIEGLVWRPMEAHPMGAKQPGFGTWSYPPTPDSREG